LEDTLFEIAGERIQNTESYGNKPVISVDAGYFGNGKLRHPIVETVRHCIDFSDLGAASRMQSQIF
jgi:hypothetical protein